MEMRRPPREWSWIERLASPIAYALVVSLFNVFPLPQRSGFRKSFEFAGESADRGYSIMIFPEGLRTSTGEMGPFQAGAGMLAQRLNIPVLPMRIDGLWEPAHAQKHFARPGTIKVRIGSPVRYGTEMTAQEIARDLEARVRGL